MVKKDLLTQRKGIPVFRNTPSSLLKDFSSIPKVCNTSGIFILLFSILFSFTSLNTVSGQASVACDDHKNVTVSGDSCSITIGVGFLTTCLNPAIYIRPNSGTAYLNYSFSGTVNGITYYPWPSPANPGPVIAGRNYLIPVNIIGTVGGPTWVNVNWQTRSPRHLKQFLGLDKLHIYECATGTTVPFNRCWGTFTLEDKLPPTISCPANRTVECADAAAYLNADIKSTSILGRPTNLADNCGLQDSSLVIEDRRLNCGGFIARHWTYTDCGGLKAICIDTVRLTPLDPARRMCPDPLVSVKCNDNVSPDGIYDIIFARTPVPALATAKDTFNFRDTTALKQAYPFFKTNGAAAFDPIGTLKKYGKLEAVCGYITTFGDAVAYPCGNSCPSKRKIIRTWTVLDWCSSVSPVFNCVQIIEATNTDGPTIQAVDLTVSVDPWACAANFSFPAPVILHDPCDPNPTYLVRGPFGVTIKWDVSTGKWIAIGVPKGTHDFIYVGKDCCGHEGYDTIKVSVFDLTPPVAIAKQNIIISLTTGGDNDGIAKLFSNSVDNGSYDSCTPVYIELRREVDPTRDNDGCNYTGNKTYNADGHPFDGSSDPNSPNYDPDNGLYVKFCCDDITNREGAVPYGIVKVWMRVWDDGNSTGKYGDTINGKTDNYNETWVNVRVEDKLTPKIICPSDVTIKCDDVTDNFLVTGKARAFSNCVDLPVDYRDQSGANNCGAGIVTRTWFVKSNPSIQCVQKITKTSPTGDFSGSNITWPRDTTTNCVTSVASMKPTWISGTCDLIGLSLKSDTFYFETGACLKILNQWTIINWCTYNANSSSQAGLWRWTQTIKVVDDERPTLGSCDPKTYDVISSDCSIRDLVITQTGDDQGSCSSNTLKWIVFVDLWGDGTNDLEYSSFLPSNDNNLTNDTNGNGINDKYLAPTPKGGTVSVTIPEIAGSMSSHKVTWRVIDGCGNVTSCTQTFMVVDKKKPTPYCVGLSSALMNNGKVELWAVDFNIGSSDNCTSKNNLMYTFNEAHPVLSKLNVSHYFKDAGVEATLAEYNAGTAQKWKPETKSSGIVFGCSSLPSIDVKMTVWDEKLNFEFCMVKLNMLDNQGACGPQQTTSIAGKMASNNGQAVKNADVILDNSVPEMLKSTVTNATGDYTFNGAVMHYDYTVAGKKTDDYLNGVSTLDLVMIQRHVLGLDIFSNPYNVIASDVNGDEKVTASDLVELRKLILGIYVQLPKSDSWKFINNKQTFADATNPWPLNEKIIISDLSQAASNQNFVAVKVGDVNGSAVGNISNAVTDTRSTVELISDNINVAANKVHAITFDAQLKNVYGMQFTLTLNNADLVDVYVGGQKLNDANVAKISDNRYTVSWNDVKAINGNELLTFNIIPKVNAAISDLVSMNSSVTSSEVYSGDDLQTSKLSLRFGGKNNTSDFAIFQNEPNPFNDKTIISFNLPAAGDATLKVFDVTGQVIYKNKGSFGKGINSFILTRNDLPSVGVMIYQIESGANVGTKKMIGLE